MKNLKNDVKSILLDFETDFITIECCDYKVGGVILTHCYYIPSDDRFVFTSGDMYEDKNSEEIILTDAQEKEILELIVECYN